MAQDGVGDEAVLVDRQFCHRFSVDELVFHAHDREAQPDPVGKHRCPDVGAEQHMLTIDDALVGEHRPCSALVDVDVLHPHVAVKAGTAGGDGQLGQGCGAMPTTYIGVGRHIVATEDHLFVEDGNSVLHLLGREQETFQPIGAGDALLARQLGQACRCGSHLDPADLVETLLTRIGEGLERPDRVFGKFGHQLRVVSLEDQPRCVRGGAASLIERPLVEDKNILPAKLSQMIGSAASCDAGADDDDGGVGAHGESFLGGS